MQIRSVIAWAFLALASCGGGARPSGERDGGAGGGGLGEDDWKLDPCSAGVRPGIDPAKEKLPSCCSKGDAHCLPMSAAAPGLERAGAACEPAGGCAPTGGLCVPDSVLSGGSDFEPARCSSLTGAEGVCLSKCIPMVAENPQSILLPQDSCREDELCVPCINPLTNVSTGACMVRELLCASGGDGGVGPDAAPLACPYLGPPIIDPATLPACAPACGGAHCVSAALVPAAQQPLLAACDAAGSPGFCTPDPLIASGGNYVPPSCRSVAGAEGRCVSTCLPSVAAQAAQLPKANCADGTVCAPCFNPIADDPMAPTGACTIACDAPAEPPLVLTCPWTGPALVDPATFPACSPACGGSHCVPEALIPADQRALLAACPGGRCAPDDVIATGARSKPPTCTSVAGAEGRCVSTCLPSVAAQAGVLPQSTCAAGTKCAPCFNPVASDPTAPTGACSIGCDAPAKPPLRLTCPWTGPDVVDPARFPACSPSCGGAHCMPEALVPAAQRSQLARCTGGYCTPDPLIRTAGNFKPASCSPFPNAPAEGRCTSRCLPQIAAQASSLRQATCAANELCAPCFDPFTGVATGACTVSSCDRPVQTAYKFPRCCHDATCVPSSLVPAAQASKLDQLNCPGAFLCVPNEYLPTPTRPITTCSTLLGGRGACVSDCVDLGLAGVILNQRQCANGYKCAPCNLAPDTPGC